jgi:hypothetical protein
MKTQKLLAATVAAFLMSAGAACATTVALDGSYSISYTPTHGNGPTINYDLGTYQSGKHDFTENLTLGTPTTATNFFTTDPNGSCGYNCVNSTASGTISVTFDFTNLTPVNGSDLTETGTYEAKYGGTKLGCTSSPGGDTDCVLWGSTTNATTGSITDIINFTNGDVLDITLYDAQDWDITPQISFELTAPTATPLPPALSLFVGGLGIFGLLGARKKRKAAAVAV